MPRCAFVLGGGGHLGAVEVGMLRALIERGVVPDLVVGTSIGAINGAAIATRPTLEAVDRLFDVWQAVAASGLFGGSMVRRLSTLARTGTHLHHNTEFHNLLEESFPVRRIEDLEVPFQCVAASIERSAEHWFDSGPLVEAVLASCALPGVLPPVRIGDEHFIDGGIVNSIPVGRAVALGATTIYVLQVGRIDSRLRPPRWPWEVGLVAFEVARRHRFMSDMAQVPEGVAVHVLPTGVDRPPRFNDWSQFRYRDFSRVARHIDHAYRASSDYLRRL
ncbi:MAG TPA: patatin-like phospholipase family protein, partial [Dehalococcoidia bacterium]|nr:patatin-like phospholipase family protein [Dehalococcoidia bacterium]